MVLVGPVLCRVSVLCVYAHCDWCIVTRVPLLINFLTRTTTLTFPASPSADMGLMGDMGCIPGMAASLARNDGADAVD